MKRIILIILSLVILLPACNTNKPVTVNKIEVIKYGYSGNVSVENRKVLNVTTFQGENDIKLFISLFNQRKELNVNYDLSGPVGRVNIYKSDSSKEEYDLWVDKEYCRIYDIQNKKLYEMTSTQGIKLLYDILQKVDAKYL